MSGKPVPLPQRIGRARHLRTVIWRLWQTPESIPLIAVLGDGGRCRRLPGTLRGRGDGDLLGASPRVGSQEPQLVRGERLEGQPRLRGGEHVGAAAPSQRRLRRDTGLPHHQRHEVGWPLHGGVVAAGVHSRLREHLRAHRKEPPRRDRYLREPHADLRGRLPLPGRAERVERTERWLDRACERATPRSCWPSVTPKETTEAFRGGEWRDSGIRTM